MSDVTDLGVESKRRILLFTAFKPAFIRGEGELIGDVSLQQRVKAGREGSLDVGVKLLGLELEERRSEAGEAACKDFVHAVSEAAE